MVCCLCMWFVYHVSPWGRRGGHWPDGIESGVFASGRTIGGLDSNTSFRESYYDLK